MADAAQPQAVTGDFALEPGRNCWRVERAKRAALVVDGEDYFKLARAAMLKAKSQILVMGWDLDTRLKLVEDDEDGDAPVHLGPFISWLAKRRPELCIHILAWDGEVYSLLGRGTTLLRMAAWRLFNKQVSFKLDSSHPREGSHHHKILVVDDAFAFCGGIDMTGSRWDTRAHKDDEPGRRRPTTHRRYHPWHDAAMALEGEAARALGDLGRIRWKIACDEELDCAEDHCDPWPDELEAQFGDVEVAIARSRGDDGENEELREIEALFLDMIATAERFIYAENQYFASRVIAEAIARRLAEPDPPEVVIINPRTGEGWLDETVMGAARAELVKSIGERDRGGRFRIYYPVTEKGDDIYVHAKLMIVDDRMLRVGSANFNNRSMGLDTECDVMIDGRRRGNRGCDQAIAALRCDLMAEHLGVDPKAVERAFAETGSLIATIERLRGGGRSLRPYQPPDFSSFSKSVARSQVADPESACEPFEPFAQHRLLRRLPRLRRRSA
ncbi:MAG TPA: phospholipase D-like domain-containing protein [Allosphingosinicella sp.]|jgi:phosphatidylserine/phosphatidylglycerophosphate/cardiolipin synthase-like enzyme